MGTQFSKVNVKQRVELEDDVLDYRKGVYDAKQLPQIFSRKAKHSGIVSGHELMSYSMAGMWACQPRRSIRKNLKRVKDENFKGNVVHRDYTDSSHTSPTHQSSSRTTYTQNCGEMSTPGQSSTTPCSMNCSRTSSNYNRCTSFSCRREHSKEPLDHCFRNFNLSNSTRSATNSSPPRRRRRQVRYSSNRNFNKKRKSMKRLTPSSYDDSSCSEHDSGICVHFDCPGNKTIIHPYGPPKQSLKGDASFSPSTTPRVECEACISSIDDDSDENTGANDHQHVSIPIPSIEIINTNHTHNDLSRSGKEVENGDEIYLQSMEQRDTTEEHEILMVETTTRHVSSILSTKTTKTVDEYEAYVGNADQDSDGDNEIRNENNDIKMDKCHRENEVDPHQSNEMMRKERETSQLILDNLSQSLKSYYCNVFNDWFEPISSFSGISKKGGDSLTEADEKILMNGVKPTNAKILHQKLVLSDMNMKKATKLDMDDRAKINQYFKSKIKQDESTRSDTPTTTSSSVYSSRCVSRNSSKASSNSSSTTHTNTLKSNKQSK